MLTAYTKERLSRPPLSIVEEGKIPEPKPMPAIEILKCVKPGDLNLDDDYSGSDISDPFESLDTKQKFEKVKKRLTRFEKNIQLMNSFSDDFKKAMDETRKEMKIRSSFDYYDMNEIDKILEDAKQPREIPASLEAKINTVFRDEENLTCGPDLDIPDREELKDEDKPKKEYDLLSNVLRLLETSSDMVASPPGYNKYQQLTPHWLDREGIDWDTMDGARLKCEEWLNTHQK